MCSPSWTEVAGRPPEPGPRCRPNRPFRWVVSTLIAVGVVACGAPPLPQSPVSTSASPPTSPARPTPVESTAPPPTPAPTLRDLPRGKPPRIGYVDGPAYHRADGTVLPLPNPPRRGWIGSARPSRSGLLVSDTKYFEGTSGLHLLNEGRSTDLGLCTSGYGAVSDDRDFLGWATFGCPESTEGGPETLLHRREPDGEVTQELPIEPNTNRLTSVVGFIGHELVYQRGFIDGVFLTDLRQEPRRIPGLISAVTLTGTRGLVAGHFDPDGRQVGVVDARSGEVLWRRRGAYPYAFSPDGKRLLSGTGRGVIVVQTDSGTVLRRIDAPPGTNFGTAVWESDRALLLVAANQSDQALVRADLNSHGHALERAGEVVPADKPGRIRYVLSE